jgi:hypothetical protein
MTPADRSQSDRYQPVVEIGGSLSEFVWRIRDTELGETALENSTRYNTRGRAMRIAANKARAMNRRDQAQMDRLKAECDRRAAKKAGKPREVKVAVTDMDGVLLDMMTITLPPGRTVLGIRYAKDADDIYSDEILQVGQ